MQIDFLEAASGAALCKTHEADANGVITTHPYPLTKNFNSYHEQVQDINELYAALTTHAAHGHCVLKGLLTKPLQAEERRGQTNSTQPTQWLCLDLDFDTGFLDIGDFVQSLGHDFHTTSYIFQHSNSAGIKGTVGLRGHLYFQLATPCSPGALKEWLKEVNFSVPALKDRLELAKNGHSLIWPLDISTCQNDKLIYISPPIFKGLSAPVTNYFSLHVGADDATSFIPSPNPGKNKAEVDTLVVALRKTQGLKTVTGKYKKFGTEQILTNPDPMIICDPRDDGEYIRCNIVGDNPSYGHYYDKEKPDILYNFKGHPLVKLVDVDPEYAAGLAKSKAAARTTSARTPIVFRDPRTDEYYNGIHDQGTGELALYRTGSTQKINDFLANHDLPMVDYVPDWTYEFNPCTTQVINYRDQWANKFTPTQLLKDALELPNKPNVSAAVPPVIESIIRSITVDAQTYDHFINWIACIFQTREKTGTAWLFSGIEGTGKGLLISKILTPIFGPRYVIQQTGQNLEDQFNAAWEEAIVLFIDEFNLHEGSTLDRTYNRLKNIVTEETIAIRAMRRDTSSTRSYTNLVMATNAGTALPLSPTDRRFNIAPDQNQRLEITQQQVVDIAAELPAFCEFLQTYQADSSLAATVLHNDARRLLINRSFTSVDLFFDAFKSGDIRYFLDYIDSSANTGFDMGDEKYKGIIREWATLAGSHVQSSELREIYNHLQNATISPAKFGRLCTHHKMEQDRLMINGARSRGYASCFPATDIDEYLKDPKKSEKVVNIK